MCRRSRLVALGVMYHLLVMVGEHALAAERDRLPVVIQGVGLAAWEGGQGVTIEQIYFYTFNGAWTPVRFQVDKRRRTDLLHNAFSVAEWNALPPQSRAAITDECAYRRLAGWMGLALERPFWAFGWDADEDLKVGGFDNRPEVSNVDRLDGDADGAGDVCDCAPSDPTMFVVPPEVEGLRFEADRVTLTWTSIKSSSGSSSVHDIVRGSLASLPVGGGAETCIGPGLDATELQDSAGPDAGAGTWYLARGRNGCGVGSYGSDSSGAPRVSTACP